MLAQRKSQSSSILYPQHIESIVLRIGWNQCGENLPSTLSAVGSHSDSVEDEKEKLNEHKRENHGNDNINDCENWFKAMWLSNMDLLQLFDCAIYHKFDEQLVPKYTICNGVSNNDDSRWSLNNDIGYQPKLNVHDYDEQNRHKDTRQSIQNMKLY